MYLEQNLKGLCQKFGIDYLSFLEDFQVESCTEIPLLELEAIAEEYEIDLQGLIFKPMFKNEFLSEKIARIKLLILDVDGVMTDGGMYFCESGDQFKKFNTKDGMGILEIQKSNQLQAAIISSAFKGEAVKQRAALLGIERCYVGRDKKLAVLETWMEEMGISIDEVAIIGDDVNITVLGVKGNQVRLGINAPKDVSVHREEIYLRIQQEKESDGSEPA